MTTVSVDNLSGQALDWAVAKAEGVSERELEFYSIYVGYSQVPNQMQPIIEREEIATMPTGDAAKWKAYVWCDTDQNFAAATFGPTALIAAARCHVANKLGRIIDIPPEIQP